MRRNPGFRFSILFPTLAVFALVAFAQALVHDYLHVYAAASPAR